MQRANRVTLVQDVCIEWLTVFLCVGGENVIRISLVAFVVP